MARRDILLLRGQERPYLIALNPLARKIYEVIVHVFHALRAKLNKQLSNSVFGYSGHADRGANRVTFNQCSNYLGASGGI